MGARILLLLGLVGIFCGSTAYAMRLRSGMQALVEDVSLLYTYLVRLRFLGHDGV